jgi:hypothetical protein
MITTFLDVMLDPKLTARPADAPAPPGDAPEDPPRHPPSPPRGDDDPDWMFDLYHGGRKQRAKSCDSLVRIERRESPRT